MGDDQRAATGQHEEVVVKSQLRILLLEDDPNDAELVQELLSDQFAIEITRAQAEDEFLAALEADLFDLILADYRLPSYDGLSALELALARCPGVPFIFVSGTIGEDVAIEALKRGATDRRRWITSIVAINSVDATGAVQR